jgi:AcrR family transcriptional regulator
MDDTAAECPKHAASAGSPGRKRDPGSTRDAILEAARAVLAQDGKEGLSVSEVARYAGINRGTAYLHFQTREQLLDATLAWVSEQLYQAVFGDPATSSDQPVGRVDLEAVNAHLAEFAMQNPELGRIWLFEVLNSRRPGDDRFFRQYKSNLERFAQTDFAQPGMDPEVIAVLMLAGSFLWPVWAHAHTRNAAERQAMAQRFSLEILRYSLHGSLRPEKYPDLESRLKRGIDRRDGK